MKNNIKVKYDLFKLYLSIIPIFLLVACLIPYCAFGHSFTTDDSTYLLTLVEKSKTELELAKKNYPSNITLSMDHSDNAARLVSETFYADDDVANDDDFTTRYNQEITTANSTANALVVVSLVDEVLRNYADSIDLNFDLTNMSKLLYVLPTTNSNNTKPELSELENSYFIDTLNNLEVNNVNTDEDRDNNPLFLSNQTVTNYAKYETAKLLAMKINTLFQLYLKSFIGLDKTKLNDITKLEDYFYEFYSMINNNSSPADIMKKVHIDIQPTMQKIYSLQTNNPQT
jgi:hypothetical protein